MARLIDGRPEAELLTISQREIGKKTNPSRILSETAENEVTRFALSELTIGEEVGRGGFSVVSNLAKISPKLDVVPEDTPSHVDRGFFQHIKRSVGIVFDGLRESDKKIVVVHGDTEPNTTTTSQDASNDNNNNEESVEVEDGESLHHDREYMAAHYMKAGGKHRYVIKTVPESARENAESFIRSVVDIALETRYLAVLRHPHIIRMRAMSSASPFGEGQAFFIVLDKLGEILSTRLESWKQRLPHLLLSCCFAQDVKELWVERLLVAYHLSSALSYLHKNKIVYRDLKPDNIGFDFHGDVKLFDFGLARELQQKLLTTEGTFLLTGGTGFPPYMAPEVALHKPYTETCDVYSFCILLWQMLKVETPFGVKLSDSHFIKRIVKGGERPEIESRWPVEIKTCMMQGWGGNSINRPSMAHIADILHDVIVGEIGSEDGNLLNISRIQAKKCD